MRTINSTWSDIVSTGDFHVETVAQIFDENTPINYTAITAPVIQSKLLSTTGLSVGNCVASTLKFTVATNNVIKKASKVVIRARVTDGTQYSHSNDSSTWPSFGTFWINSRSANHSASTPLVDLECYDAMLKGNQQYVDDSQSLNWPKSISTVLNRVVTLMGLSFDSRTSTYISGLSGAQAGDIVTKPKTDGTLLDVLANIGKVLGGNWIITPDNALRFVPVITPPSETYYIIDEEHNRIQTDDEYNLVYQDNPTSPVIPTGIGEISVPVVLGTITNGRPYSISRVTMTLPNSDPDLNDGEDYVYTYGDDTGYTLDVGEIPFASDALCLQLYNTVNGIRYVPYTMTDAVYDPAAELGDWIIAGNRVYGVLYNETRKLDIYFSSSAESPYESEIESEYPYVSQTQRAMKYIERNNASIYSRIEQTAEGILLEVTSKYGEVEESDANLLLDTNAPTLAAVDGPSARKFLQYQDWSSSQWGSINAPLESIDYGVTTTFADKHTYHYEDNVARTVFYDGCGLEDKIEPLEVCTFSVYIKTTVSGIEANSGYYTTYQNEYHDGGNKSVSSDGNWHRYSWTIAAPASTYYGQNKFIKIEFRVANPECGPGSVLLCGFKVEKGTVATDWNDGINLVHELVTTSSIEQHADSIRLKATKLMWESENSSMSADGTLTFGKARLEKNWSGVVDGDGLLIGRTQIISVSNGNPIFSIELPNKDPTAVSSYVSYDESTGEETVITGFSDDIVPEIPETDIELASSTYLCDEAAISTNGLGISFGVNGDRAMKIGTDNTIFIEAPAIGFISEYESGSGEYIKTVTYGYTGTVTAGTATLDFTCGILTDVSGIIEI